LNAKKGGYKKQEATLNWKKNWIKLCTRGSSKGGPGYWRSPNTVGAIRGKREGVIETNDRPSWLRSNRIESIAKKGDPLQPRFERGKVRKRHQSVSLGRRREKNTRIKKGRVMRQCCLKNTTWDACIRSCGKIQLPTISVGKDQLERKTDPKSTCTKQRLRLRVRGGKYKTRRKKKGLELIGGPNTGQRTQGTRGAMVKNRRMQELLWGSTEGQEASKTKEKIFKTVDELNASPGKDRSTAPTKRGKVTRTLSPPVLEP